MIQINSVNLDFVAPVLYEGEREKQKGPDAVYNCTQVLLHLCLILIINSFF